MNEPTARSGKGVKREVRGRKPLQLLTVLLPAAAYYEHFLASVRGYDEHEQREHGDVLQGV